MKKSQRVQIISHRLDQLYPNPPIPLKHKDAFTLLIAVVLSAQCTDKKVNEITPHLFEIAPSPSLMSELGEEKIYEYIKSIGLAKQKAKYLQSLSRMIITKFSGDVPSNLSDLETLPGVGHKTASVVMAQAFNSQTFPVDTHIHRLAQRWELSDGSSVVKTEEDLKSLFPKNNWNKLHLQIIYYGREYCTARGCDGMKCLICMELFPQRKLPIVCKKP